MKKTTFGLMSLAFLLLFPNQAFADTVKVKKGDTLYSISKNNHLTVDELKKLNNLSSTTIYIGQVLKTKATQNVINPPTTSNPVPSEPIKTNTYKVVKGDTLSKISRAYKVTVNDIKKWNNLKNDIIYIGQSLKIHNDTPPVQIPVEVPSEKPVEVPKNENPVTEEVVKVYKVVKGDTLSKISRTYKVTVNDIKKWNNLKNDMIYIGQSLKLYAEVSTPAPTPSESTQNEKVDNIIKEAQTLMGVPYLWAGTTVKGFDCSGFVTYLFSKQNIKLPRTTQQLWNAGTKVEQLNVGDLVFYETYAAGPSHVGIYMGNGKFIGAQSSTGVAIVSMDNSYWKPRYLGAKRMF